VGATDQAPAGDALEAGSGFADPGSDGGVECPTIFASRADLENLVVHLHRLTKSEREVERRLKVTRSTIHRILQRHRHATTIGDLAVLKPKRIPRTSKLDSFKEQIHALVSKFPDARPKRVHQILSGAGFTGGYTIVKDYLRSIAQKPVVEVVERFETAPGEQGQQDWSPYKFTFGTQHAFSFILGYSRRQHMEFMDGEDLYQLMRGHVHAFARLDGVPATCLYDNQKAVVIRWELGQPIYNTKFLAFATHYGFRPRALPKRRPKLKGKVERPFLFLETSFLNCREVSDADDLRAQFAHWLDNDNDLRIHETTRRRPIDLHAEERPHLLPVPVLAYDTSEVVYRIASTEALIEWDGNYYSVPPKYVAQSLAVKVGEHTLAVYSPDIERLVEHDLQPPGCGEVYRKPEHAISRSSKRAKDLDLLAPIFLAWGPAADEYLTGLKRTQSRTVAHHVAHILELKRRYSPDDIVIALEHALRYHAYDARAIDRILASQARERTLEEPLPQPFKEELAQWIRDNPLKPRALNEYQRLIEDVGCPTRNESTTPADVEAARTDHDAVERSDRVPERPSPPPDGEDPEQGDRGSRA
jgi:transposase